MSTDVPASVPQRSSPVPRGWRPVVGVSRPGPAGPRRRLTPGGGWLLASRIVLGIAVAVTVMATALAVGMRLDDQQIDGHLATATATVLSVSPLRTGVEFVDGAGVTVRPPNGVLYPGLLSVGQRFQIEYSSLDPTVVRVAGRTAAVGDLVLALTFVLTWGIAVLAWWLCRRASRRRRAVAIGAAGLPAPDAAVSGD